MDRQEEPIVLYEREITFAKARAMATDGVGLVDETSVTGNAIRHEVLLPIPATELGGMVFTFLSVKPDEKIQSMPDPLLTATWKMEQDLDEQLLLDPVPVKMKQLNADVANGSTETVAFWTGHNELKRSYVDYGFNRQTDVSTMENLNAIFQLAIPASVTPENVIYPASLPQTPWPDTLAEICVFTVETTGTYRTPLVFGPTPVEEIDILDTEEILPV